VVDRDCAGGERLTRSPYTNPAVESAVRKLEREYGDAFRRLRVYLERALAKLNRDGKLLVRDRFNVHHINSVLNELQATARELGFGDVIKTQTKELRGLTKAILKEAQELKGATKFSALTGETIKAMMMDAQRVVIGEEAAVSRQLEFMLRRSLTGNVEWMDLVGQLQTQLKLTETQAITKSLDVVSSFHTSTRVEHFEARDADGTITGVEWWLYAGARDDRNRDFCAHFVGTRVTTAILDSYADQYGRKHPAPPSMSLGGYGCRHELVPLPMEEQWGKYREGPIAPGASREVKKK